MPINFYLGNRPDRNGNFPIRISWIYEGRRFMTTLGYSVYKDCWLPKIQEVLYKEQINSSGIKGRIINDRIERCKDMARMVENHMKLNHRKMPDGMFREAVGYAKDPPNGLTIEKIFKRLCDKEYPPKNSFEGIYYDNYGTKFILLYLARCEQEHKQYVVYQSLSKKEEVFVMRYRDFFNHFTKLEKKRRI